MSKKKSGGGRVFLVILCIVLGLILAALITGTVYANYLLGLMNRPDDVPKETLSQEQIDAILKEDTVAPDESTAPEVKEEDVDWGQNEGEVIESGTNIVNILLIGQDARPGETNSRSDSMIMVTFNKEQKTITMTSFLRDLYVSIPGYHDNRINAAYAMGGMALLKQTIRENFDLDVDGCIEVDFQNFAQIIDLLGGVTLTLRQDEADYINHETEGTLSEGSQTLNGPQALTYARIRSLDLDGDFSRTDRQRKVMAALMESYRKARLSALLPLIREILPMLSTDLSAGQILMLALETAPKLSDATLVSQCIPAPGTYRDQTIDGMSVLVADMDAARQLLSETVKQN